MLLFSIKVVASLLYADNAAPVENTTDAEPALLMSCDGIEYGSQDKPCKLINGRTSFKLKISQVCTELISFISAIYHVSCQDVNNLRNFGGSFETPYRVGGLA